MVIRRSSIISSSSAPPWATTGRSSTPAFACRRSARMTLTAPESPGEYLHQPGH